MGSCLLVETEKLFCTSALPPLMPSSRPSSRAEVAFEGWEQRWCAGKCWCDRHGRNHLESSDQDVAQQSAHQPERFAELFERYFASIHRYAGRSLGAIVADDIAAETFLIVLCWRDRYEPPQGSVRSW